MIKITPQVPTTSAQNKNFACTGQFDLYDTNPGGQVNFCNGHKITVVIWPVAFSKDLSTLDVRKVMGQVRH